MIPTTSNLSIKTWLYAMFPTIKKRQYNLLMTINFNSLNISEDGMKESLYRMERSINRYLLHVKRITPNHYPYLFRYIAVPQIDDNGIKHYHMIAFLHPTLRKRWMKDKMKHIEKIASGVGFSRHGKTFRRATLHIDNLDPTLLDQEKYWDYMIRDVWKGEFSEIYVESQPLPGQLHVS